MTEVITFPGVASRPSKAQRESARTRFPPRPVDTDWPATRQERGEAWQQRWMASGADTDGGAWRQVPIAWQHQRGRKSR